MTDELPRVRGELLVVTVEEHKTGIKSTLELCEFWDGFRWMKEGKVLTDLEPRHSAPQAATYLAELLKDTHILHWPRNKIGTRRPYSLRKRSIHSNFDTTLAFELGTIAALHGVTSGEMLRKIALDYIRPGAPKPLPPISKEYIQSLLEPYRNERWTSGAVTPGKRKPRKK